MCPSQAIAALGTYDVALELGKKVICQRYISVSLEVNPGFAHHWLNFVELVNGFNFYAFLIKKQIKQIFYTWVSYFLEYVQWSVTKETLNFWHIINHIIYQCHEVDRTVK